MGYAATSIEAIARRAEVGKQTIYRWWPSKGLLLLDALQASAGEPAPSPTRATSWRTWPARSTRSAGSSATRPRTRAPSDRRLIELLYAPLYYRLLVTHQPLDPAYIEAHLAAVFAVVRRH